MALVCFAERTSLGTVDSDSGLAQGVTPELISQTADPDEHKLPGKHPAPAREAL